MNYCVRFMNLPTTVCSFVRCNDGFYTIVINARLSASRQMDAFLHELTHIRGDDFSRYDADVLEQIAHEVKK